MSEELNVKPRRRWDLFIARSLLAGACFVIGVTMAFPIHLLFTSFRDIPLATAFFIFARYFLPFAVCTGAGIGILLERFWRGLLIGGGIGVALRLIAEVVDRPIFG